MKKITFLLTLFIVSSITTMSLAQQNILVTGSRFTYPLVEKWIAEYKKINPTADITIFSRGVGIVEDSANLVINAHELTPQEIRPGYKVVNIGRYVLLPIANAKNKRVQEYIKEGIDEKTIKRIFFEKYDITASVDAKQKARDEAFMKGIMVYTREQKACAPTTFAKNFGFEQKDIKGKGIGGDDKHLILAVLKDTNGVTYNNPGLIYDLTTRAVKPGLVVLPTDVNDNNKLDEQEKIYDNLDNLITNLESKKLPSITYGYVNLSFPQDLVQNKALADFILWILKDGQKYNHDFGFLNLEEEVLSKQFTILTQAK